MKSIWHTPDEKPELLKQQTPKPWHREEDIGELIRPIMMRGVFQDGEHFLMYAETMWKFEAYGTDRKFIEDGNKFIGWCYYADLLALESKLETAVKVLKEIVDNPHGAACHNYTRAKNALKEVGEWR